MLIPLEILRYITVNQVLVIKLFFLTYRKKLLITKLTK